MAKTERDKESGYIIPSLPHKKLAPIPAPVIFRTQNECISHISSHHPTIDFVIQAENWSFSFRSYSAFQCCRAPSIATAAIFYTKIQRHLVDLVAGVGGNKGNTLLNVLLEVDDAGVEEALLGGVDVADGEDLLDTIGAELDAGAEELDTLLLVERGLDKGGLNDLLASGSAEERVRHAGTSHGHGEGGRASTVLGLDDLITTELDTLDELSVGAEVRVAALAEERDNGDTGVATDNGDVLVLGVSVLDLGDEAAGADNVEGGDTEEGLGVVDTGVLEDLGADGDGRVDGVGNDEGLGLGGGLGNSLGEVANDGSVGVEEVVTGHAGLAGDTSGDEDDLGILEGGGETLGGRLVAGDLGLGVDVGDVGSDTCESNWLALGWD